MPRYKIQVILIADQPANASSSRPNEVVFDQTFDDLDLRSLIRDLNAPQRKRRKSAAAVAT